MSPCGGLAEKCGLGWEWEWIASTWGTIWLIRHALVCMSLLDLLLQIKITVSIGFFFPFINHWFPNTHFTVLYEISPQVKWTMILTRLGNILQYHNYLYKMVERCKGSLCPHLLWSDTPLCHMTFISWYSRRRHSFIINTAEWAPIRVAFVFSSLAWHSELVCDHVPTCCICVISRQWNRYVS